jgi:hypothetical protein
MINYSQMPSLGQTVENYNANIDQIKAAAAADMAQKAAVKQQAMSDLGRLRSLKDLVMGMVSPEEDPFAGAGEQPASLKENLFKYALQLNGAMNNPYRAMRPRPEEDPFSSPAVDMEEDPFAPTPLDRIKMALGMSSAAKPEDEFEVFSPSRPINSAMNAASAALLKRAEMYNQMMGNPMRAVR